MVTLLFNTRDATPLAYTWRRQHAIARDRVLQMVLLTPRAQVDATNVVDGQRRLRDWLGLYQNAWDVRKAWWRWWNIEDSGTLGLRSFRRFSFVVLGGVMMMVI